MKLRGEKRSASFSFIAKQTDSRADSADSLLAVRDHPNPARLGVLALAEVNVFVINDVEEELGNVHVLEQRVDEALLKLLDPL
jgi:hypothetical protein